MAFSSILQSSAPGATAQAAFLSSMTLPAAFPKRYKQTQPGRMFSSVAKTADVRHFASEKKIHSSNRTSKSLVRASYNGVPKSLKSRLADGEQLYGVFLLSFSPVLAEIVGYAGYDYAVVDMEHGPGDTMAALPMLQALASTNTAAILRIPDNDPVMAKKAMDLGPQGLMIPMIDGPKAAKRAVSYCLYPPKGIRGACHPAVRASQYGINGTYLETYEDELLIMCQVESEEAVKRIDDIASVDGVDCIQMGPTDMSASMGYLSNPGHKKAKEMLKRAEKSVLGMKNGPYLGGFAMPDDSPADLWKRGYHMVSGALDIGLFRNAALEDVRKYKGSALGSVGIISPSEILDGDESGESEKEIEKEYA
eukprot:Gb_26202 [translate_table: standard]